MPYDANGQFKLVESYKVQTGNKVLPSQHNPPFEDVQSGMSQVLMKDGRAAMAGDLDMGNNKITNVADGENASDVATVGQAALLVGDFRDSARTQSSDFLRRDGSVYSSATYPALSAILGPLDDGLILSQIYSGGSGRITDFIYGFGRYVAVISTGDSFLTSIDKVDWSPVDNAFDGVRIGGGTFAAGIFIVGAISASNHGVVLKSANGLSWSQQQIMTSHECRDVAHDGTNFIAVGGTNTPRAAWSVNGSTWTVVTPPGSATLQAVAANNTRVVAVGTAGAIVTSDNHGQTWTSRTSGLSVDLTDVIWDPHHSLFIACGFEGKVVTSPDGITWTARSSGLGAGGTTGLFGIAAAPNTVVIVGYGGVATFSSNGTTYTPVATAVGASLQGIALEQDSTTKFLVGTRTGTTTIFEATRTASTQFQVPNDNPTYGWIKAR